MSFKTDILQLESMYSKIQENQLRYHNTLVLLNDMLTYKSGTTRFHHTSTLVHKNVQHDIINAEMLSEHLLQHATQMEGTVHNNSKKVFEQIYKQCKQLRSNTQNITPQQSKALLDELKELAASLKLPL
jgi:hypothetical protein